MPRRRIPHLRQAALQNSNELLFPFMCNFYQLFRNGYANGFHKFQFPEFQTDVMGTSAAFQVFNPYDCCSHIKYLVRRLDYSDKNNNFLGRPGRHSACSPTGKNVVAQRPHRSFLRSLCPACIHIRFRLWKLPLRSLPQHSVKCKRYRFPEKTDLTNHHLFHKKTMVRSDFEKIYPCRIPRNINFQA